MEQQSTCLNLVLLGKTGAGKSATGNTILGKKAFSSAKSPNSVTKDVVVESKTIDGGQINVYDTPGLSDIDMDEKEIQQMINEKVLQKCESGLCAFLLVIKADRFTEDDRKTVEKIEKILGQNSLEKTWILFTRGDELEEENTTIKEFINQSEPLKTLIQKYGRRYHIFNNKEKTKKNKKHISSQVKMLLTKILQFAFSRKIVKLKDRVKRKITRNVKQYSDDSLQSTKIMMLGKSGVGKSAAGNTILGQSEFSSVMSTNSVTSACSEAHGTVSGRSVSVVDTPGFFDTKMNPEELQMEIARSFELSPGPHAFLIVFPVNMRFTEQEQQIADQVETLFGEGVLKYSMILFTHGDQLEGTTVEKLIQANSKLRTLIQDCGGRYQLFNNKDLNNREQVNDLLQKIDSMVQQNGGGHYTNQMFEDAQRFRQEEEEKRKQEEKQRQEKIEKAIEEKIRADFDKQKEPWLKRFISEYSVGLRIAAYALVGVAAGAVVGVGLGALIGAVLGFAAVAFGAVSTAGAVAAVGVNAAVVGTAGAVFGGVVVVAVGCTD